MGRDDDIAAIVALGRQTRTSTPRWLWIAAAVVGIGCALGFAVVMLEAPAPLRAAPAMRSDVPVARRAEVGPGLGTGLAIGVAVGLVIGFSIGRHRRDHSSRNRP